MELGNPSCGVNFSLEEQANAILREGRRGITALSAKKDYLTEEQLTLRQNREVYNVNGVPDCHIMSGLYRRAYNPIAGARPTGLRLSEE
jgi:hypothetical protein